MSLCYDYEHKKDYTAFKAAVLKLFGAKRPFDTTQVKKDPQNFPANVWNQHFVKCCYDDEEQFMTLLSEIK